MKLNKKEALMVMVLALLTALESLSIDLYLPAFKVISSDLHTNMGMVQISLSVFLGGFAAGQLLWGPLSDKLGRKKTLLIAVSLYTVVSAMVLISENIYELWLYRFLQAFTGSSGVVIARAVVKDRFLGKRTAEIFGLLGLIMGIAPITAPSIGNYLLGTGHWHTIFIAMSILGLICVVLVIFFLPETLHKDNSEEIQFSRKTNLLHGYIQIFKDRQFRQYAAIASITYCSLMIYISNSPYLILEKAGYSGTAYSLIFGANAIGMMMASFSVTRISKYFSIKKIVKLSAIVQITAGLLLVTGLIFNISIVWILFFLFLYLVPTGMLFPTTTALALEYFSKDSGRASAVLGFTQLAITFVFSGIVGLFQDNSIAPMILSLLSCAIFSYIISNKK